MNETAARDMLAEIGTDMPRCGSATRLASWVGVCPGNNASAGQRRRGQRRRGHRYVRRVWVQGVWAARKTPTCLGRMFRRLEARVGGKQAALAVAQNIVVIVYHLLAEGTCDDEERDERLQPRQEERQRKRALKALEQRGDVVTLERVASSRGRQVMTRSRAGRAVGPPRKHGTRPARGWCVSATGNISWERYGKFHRLQDRL